MNAEVSVNKWNVNCDLQYTKCTEDDLLKLYGTLKDTYDLTEKVRLGINLLNLHDTPITIESGFKCDAICREHLSAKLPDYSYTKW